MVDDKDEGLQAHDGHSIYRTGSYLSRSFLNELKDCLGEWTRRGYDDGPNKHWANPIIDFFKTWKKYPKSIHKPVNNHKSVPDLNYMMELISDLLNLLITDPIGGTITRTVWIDDHKKESILNFK